jgi:hypothetical protein
MYITVKIHQEKTTATNCPKKVRMQIYKQSCFRHFIKLADFSSRHLHIRCIIRLYLLDVLLGYISLDRTLLDVSKYTAAGKTGADMQSRVDELEHLNQAMRDRDRLKDDAIAHLSDKVIALTARLDSIEKRQ